MTTRKGSDIAARMLRAMSRKRKPHRIKGAAFDEEWMEKVGKAPTHIHHLRNLRDEIQKRLSEAEASVDWIRGNEKLSRKIRSLKSDRDAVQKTIDASLETFFDLNRTRYKGFDFLEDGSVVGILATPKKRPIWKESKYREQFVRVD